MTFELRGPAASIVVLLMGIAFMGMSIFVYRMESDKRARCDATTTAVVVDLIESYSDDSFVYYPIYSFLVDGYEYEVESNMGSNPPAHRVGDKVTLKYNSMDPYEFYEVGEKFTTIICLVFFVAGAIMTLVGLWLVIRLFI